MSSMCSAETICLKLQLCRFASVDHFDQAEMTVKQGTEADAALSKDEEKTAEDRE